ncbi:Calx-beta domain-containing protein [Candidatus Palauibacter sp.]|uniref:Calx-beta domain-containing protein n=1 Tax=Candidatus Palauibacter sp. TaxID=3101350 RepID=UPI003B526E25
MSDDFTDDGTSYAVTKFFTRNGVLTFRLDTGATAATQGLTLVIDSEEFVLKEANQINGAKTQWKWNSTTLGWTAGTDVAVSLVVTDAPATGQPTISGGGQVGKTLTVATDYIEDPDGLPTTPTFTYQWVRVDGSTDTDIPGATSETYTLTASDLGKQIKVKVSFTDLRGHAEGPLTSDAYPRNGTVTVVVLPGPCPAVNDWCATMTVADDGTGFGYEFDKSGSLDDNMIEYGGKEIEVFKLYVVIQSTRERFFFESFPRVPLGTVITVGDLTLTTDAESNDGSLANKWDYNPGELPPDLLWLEGQEVRISLVLGSFPAEGAVTISGTARKGLMLTADISDISDPDGLTNPSYTYQWVQVDGTTETDITGATGASYTPVADDVGKQVKIRVGFTDDRAHPEAVTSEAYPSSGSIGDSTIRSLVETFTYLTVQEAEDIGDPVRASGVEGPVTYRLEGEDADKFMISSSSGQLSTRVGERYDYEEKPSYVVTVNAVSQQGGSVSILVIINIVDLAERPTQPGAPTVSATAGSITSLDVSWTAPSNVGRPPITHYNLRYREDSVETWTDGPQNVTGTAAQITGLTADTPYQVGVQAVNHEGSVWSGYGAGRTDAPTVSFGASAYTAIEGVQSAAVTVQLDPPASSAVTIPVTTDPQGGATSADYDGVPGSVTFAAGETEQTFTVTATDDSVDDDGESVQLGFGDLPSGVLLGSPSTARVALVQDAGVTTWYVWFGESDYTVAEGGTARITLHLNAPWKPELNEALTVPLFDPQHEGGASADDYSGVPESVTFQRGQTRASFTVRATDDSEDDDGESVLLHFRRLFPDDLEVGRYGARVATLHIDDDDGETAVTVSFESANYTAEEGGAPATVRVLLDAAPGRSATIELTATGRGGATSADYAMPSSVTFGASETEKSFTLTATDDAVDDDLESVAIGFGSLPSGIAAGSPSVAVVNLTDNDSGTNTWTVNFGARAGTVRDGVKEGGGYFLSFKLDRKTGRILTIPLKYEYLGGATAADFTDLPSAVTFDKNETGAGVTISPVDDFDVDPGESIRVSFGAMPAGVRVGSYGGRSTIIPVIDNDGPPGLSVADASAGEWPNKRVCLVFEVTLDRKVDDVVSVDYATADGTAVAGQDYVAVSGTLEFRKGQNRKRLCVEVIYDEIDESTEKMTLRLYNPVRAYLSDATATGFINSASGERAFGGESEAADMVAGLSVEAVARVLFGEAELSADQRAAFDYLGNRNGVLDLGDLLSWRARCRRDEVRCGGPGSATDAGSLPASPAMPPTKRDRRTPPRRRRGARAGRRSGRNMGGSVERVPQQRSGAAGRGPGRRGPAVRRATGWIRALVPGLVVSAWGCGIGEDLIQPVQPDPGPLHVRLAVPPQARDIGVLLVVEGPGIDSLSAPGFELIQADEASSNRREAIMTGSLSTGPVLQVWVPDRRQLGHYRVELVQVAGDDYGLRDPTQYGIAISR